MAMRPSLRLSTEPTPLDDGCSHTNPFNICFRMFRNVLQLRNKFFLGGVIACSFTLFCITVL